jgi:hypothetical protein
MKRWTAVLRFCFLLALVAGRTGLAQAPAPVTLAGTVVDPSGAVIQHAAVHVHGAQVEATSRTDGVGRFSVRVLPGRYDLSVEAPGFQVYTRPGLLVAAEHNEPLKISLAVAGLPEQVEVPSEGGLSTEADANKSALVFKGEQLDTFSDDPAVMQQQLQVIGGTDPGSAPQLYVDGFSNGVLPPKQSIREVRINQNFVTSESSEFGRGRIEVFTKPGSDKLHGSLEFNYGDSTMNARNPYTGPQPPYSNDYSVANVEGPLGKKTSFFFTGQRSDLSQNEVVNAVVLDSSLNPVALSEPVANEVVSQSYSIRLDRQFGANDTFIGRYTFANVAQPDAGVGLLVLPSQAYANTIRTQTLQLSDTHFFGAKVVLDAAGEYIHTRQREDPFLTAPTLIVQGSFSDGGSPTQALHDNQDRIELHDYFSILEGTHFIRTGVRYRLLRDANLASAGFNGQFVFPNITTYRDTLIDLQNGLSGDAIRAKGDGASQFSLSAGNPSASVTTGDVGVYGEDEWKAASNFTLNYGLRLESQSAVPDHLDIGPRVAFAYAVTPKTAKTPVLVVRGGFGIFYKRFASVDILTSRREDGVREQVYFVNDPSFYPNVPTPASLGVATPSTVYKIAPHLHEPVQLQGVIGVEHSFGKIGSVAVNYFPRRQYHELESINANAPLPGTYNVNVPGSGVRPLGTSQNVYEFYSAGISKGHDLTVNAALNPTPKFGMWAFFSVGYDKTDAGGADSFVSNSYDIGADFADYNGFSPRQLYTGINARPGWGTSFNLFMAARSQANFDITTGQDNNGDSIYNDRPAFATDLTRSSVVQTRWGNFDTSPLPGQTIIPHNYGRAPDFVYMELSARKDFQFGPRFGAAKADLAMATGPSAKKPELPPQRYRLQFGISADNLLNHNNPGPPVGILSSSLFGKSISLNAPFTSNSAANRAITLRTAFFF